MCLWEGLTHVQHVCLCDPGLTLTGYLGLQVLGAAAVEVGSKVEPPPSGDIAQAGQKGKDVPHFTDTMGSVFYACVSGLTEHPNIRDDLHLLGTQTTVFPAA